MAGQDTEYEKFVRSIVEALLRAQGLETVKVEHDKQVRGTSTSHQIDVYWEYRLAGVLHRVVVNCKRYKGTVEKTDVLTLKGVLSDMPGVLGVIVTTVGFQKGAIEFAQQHGIGLKIIRPPKDEDWEGRIRTIRGTVSVRTPKLLDCQVRLDAEWIKANVPDPSAVVGPRTVTGDQTMVRDLRTGVAENLNQIWNRVMRQNPTPEGEEGHAVLRWDDARFEQPGAPPLRIAELELRWEIGPSETALTFESRHDPDAIVRDAIAGTLLFVDASGKVTGDVEDELGRKQ